MCGRKLIKKVLPVFVSSREKWMLNVIVKYFKEHWYHFSQKNFHFPPHTGLFKTITLNIFPKWLKLSIWKKDKLVPNITRITWYRSHQRHLLCTQRIHMAWGEAYYVLKINLWRVFINISVSLIQQNVVGTLSAYKRDFLKRLMFKAML